MNETTGSAGPKRIATYVDPYNAPPLFVDWIMTGGTFEGVLNLSLGSVDHTFRDEESDLPRVAVLARLRMSIEFAERLQAALGDLVKKSKQNLKPADPGDLDDLLG